MSGHRFQAGKPTLIVQLPASQYARPVEDGGPAADVPEDLLGVAGTQRWVSKLFASASLATDTRAYPNRVPFIFCWPPVLAGRRDSAAGGVLAMLKLVPL